MMDATTDHDEERIAELLRLLPPVPTGWLDAAQELPTAMAAIDQLVVRARADAELRDRVIADLEQALARTGVTPSTGTVELLRRRLDT